MVLYACVLCFMHFHFVENPLIDLEAMNSSLLMWFYHMPIARPRLHLSGGITTRLSRGQNPNRMSFTFMDS
jgi:hypothetical protein